jgi:hypothetical protein
VANEGLLSGTTVSEFTPRAAAGGVVIRPAQPGQPIRVGTSTGTGLTLSNAELAQIFTTAAGTITFGDATQTGNITFADVTPATTPGTSVAAVQAANGPGAIILDSTAGTALAVGGDNVHLSAGKGGIVATGGAATPSIASTGQVSLDTPGSIGSSGHRILFDAAAAPAAVAVGTTTAPAAGVYLGGQGSLTLGNIQAANLASLDATAADDLTVGGAISVGDVNLTAPTVTVNAGASVTGAFGGTLAIRADTLNLVGPLSVGSSGLVTVTPLTAGRDIDLGGNGPTTDLVLSDNALGQVTAGTLRLGGTAYTSNITVTGDVARHFSYDTLSLQTTNGTINAASGATLAAINLALQAGTGIGTTGRMAIEVIHLAFASQKGPIQLSDANALTLASVDTLPAPSIPGDVFSASKVGAVYTLLSSGGRISGQITYLGKVLAEGHADPDRRPPLPDQLPGWHERPRRDSDARRRPHLRTDPDHAGRADDRHPSAGRHHAGRVVDRVRLRFRSGRRPRLLRGRYRGANLRPGLQLLRADRSGAVPVQLVARRHRHGDGGEQRGLGRRGG